MATLSRRYLSFKLSKMAYFRKLTLFSVLETSPKAENMLLERCCGVVVYLRNLTLRSVLETSPKAENMLLERCCGVVVPSTSLKPTTPQNTKYLIHKTDRVMSDFY